MLEVEWWSWAILLPIAGLASWLLLLRQSSRSTSKIYFGVSACLPPLATTYSLLSWYIGIVAYALPGLEERQHSLLFHLVTGTFWRKPLNWLFDKMNIFGLPRCFMWVS